MRKVLAVALAEYRSVVLTKSFLFSLLIPFLLYGGMILAGVFLGDKTDLTDRKLVVVDRTGMLIDSIKEANQERNRSDQVVRDGKQIGPKFVIEPYDTRPIPGKKQLLVELSDRVREDEIFAFAIIGEDYTSPQGGDGDYLQYYSNSPTFNRLPDWLSRTVRDSVERIRFAEAGYDSKEISLLTSHNRLERFNLAEVDTEGNLVEPEEENRIAAILIPMGLVLLLFISIQMCTPVLLNSVIEEKMQRIVEVLLSSVTAFQLLWGKLLAGVGVGLTFSAVYLVSLSFTLRYFERLSWVPAGTYVWFFVFLLAGLLTFGSLFAGVSSVCQDLKDSQNFAGTIVIVLVIPMMLTMVSIESPNGPLATTVSMIPPFSVMSMLSRLAVPPGPPMWQVYISLAANTAFTVLVVWASSRLFRIGILSQGKAPSWKEIIRWIFQRG